MFAIIFSMLVVSYVGDEEATKGEAQSLMDKIEAIQQPIEDFRCEFEGSLRYQGNLAERMKREIRADGLYETFSGTFLWKRGGDTHSETLNRRALDNMIARELLAIRPKENQAEEYRRLNDAPMGYSVIKSPKEVNSWRPNCLGYLFLFDKLKDQMTWGYERVVSDDVIDGRPLKILSFGLKSKTVDMILFRYWIDLNRSGHVVRAESYLTKDKVGSRMDIKLDPFKIGEVEIWMPVYGVYRGYGVFDSNNTPSVANEPTLIDTIYVVGGTMEFNKKLGPEAFRIDYKMGTPISDELKKLNIEYGQQKIGLKPSKADAEKMLKEQVAKAEAQKNELVVATGLGGFDWWPWAVGGLIVSVIGSLVALGVQGRLH